MSSNASRRSMPGLVLACGILVAASAGAGTPDFQEDFDASAFGNRVPVTFPALLGTVNVFAPAGARIVDDPTCDPLSTQALLLDSTLTDGGFEVRFVHQDGPHGVHLDEQEVMSLKLGQVRTDVWGAKAGFASTDGFQVLPVQLGPALPGDADPRFGRIYVFGEPTEVRYGNVLLSACTGFVQANYQVNVTFTLYGHDNLFYVTVASLAPVPAQQRFGPYPIPAQFATGYGSCMVSCQAGAGQVLIDGVECIASAVIPIDPIESFGRTHRNPSRR